MRTSMIVVDDFLENPDEIRRAALSLDYPKLGIDTYFPGRNSQQHLTIGGLEPEVSRLVGERLVPTPGTGHARCRSALANDKGRASIHIDESHWSGILYLTLPEHCQGGTDFFRHKPTNSDHAPLNPEELAAMGLKSFDEVWTKILQPDTNNPAKWEHIMRVPMRFNRLILLRPWLWHNAGPSFGTGIENGRLIYLMFFNSPDAT